MKITILCVGKIKERFFRDGIEEYKKRLSKYCKLEIMEVADEKTPDRASEAEEQKIKEKEAERLEKYIKKDAYVVVLAIDGKMLDSVELSEKINKLGIGGTSHIIFIIGGSLGLTREFVTNSNFVLSFSKLTFPHQLIRLFLLEQIFRSFKIINNEKYHH